MELKRDRGLLLLLLDLVVRLALVETAQLKLAKVFLALSTALGMTGANGLLVTSRAERVVK